LGKKPQAPVADDDEEDEEEEPMEERVGFKGQLI
jgi:hypothetical protein